MRGAVGQVVGCNRFGDEDLTRLESQVECFNWLKNTASTEWVHTCRNDECN